MEGAFGIYQLRQSQIPSLPFELVKVLQTAQEGTVLTSGVEGWYVIIPVPLNLSGISFSDAFNILFSIVAKKGFSHLMLVYGERPN